MSAPVTIDSYIAALDEPARSMSEQLRQTIRAAAPEAVEDIKYAMPAFKLGGRNAVYFAVWKKHIGLYPIYRGDAAFEAQVGPYRAAKDTVKLMLDRPLPLDLITLIVRNQRGLV